MRVHTQPEVGSVSRLALSISAVSLLLPDGPPCTTSRTTAASADLKSGSSALNFPGPMTAAQTAIEVPARSNLSSLRSSRPVDLALPADSSSLPS